MPFALKNAYIGLTVFVNILGNKDNPNNETIKIFNSKKIYTYRLRHFANKLKNACARVIAYTFGISTPVI